MTKMEAQSSTTSLATVISLLTALSKDELNEVIARARFLKDTAAAKDTVGPAAEGSDEDLMLTCITRTLSGLGVEFTSPAMLRASQQYRAFREKVPSVMTYIRRAAPTRVQQDALLKLGIKLLYDNLNKAGHPVSARFVLNHMHRLPSIFNQAFPGYARSGKLHMLVGAEKPDVRKE